MGKKEKAKAKAQQTPQPKSLFTKSTAPKGKKRTNPWMTHLRKVRASNKGMSLKNAMKLASKSYKK